MSNAKRYVRCHQAHPDDAHTDSKRFFKRKGRKRVRKNAKQQLRKEVS